MQKSIQKLMVTLDGLMIQMQYFNSTKNRGISLDDY